MPNHLSIVPPAVEAGAEAAPPSEMYDLGRGPESVAERVKRLQREAKILAQEEVEGLERKLTEVAAHARAISEGGDAYAAGVRDLAGRLASDLDQKTHMLQALLEKTANL